jgi:hypothetical protein
VRPTEQFGSAEQRSSNGALLDGEVQRVKGFLRGRGLLSAEGLGGRLVVVHAALVADVERPLLDVGLQRIVLGASVEGLRSAGELTVAETRAFEVLSPGPLIVATGRDESAATLMAIPDRDDLREIAHSMGGTVTAFLATGTAEHTQLARFLKDGRADDLGFSRLGFLEPPDGRRDGLEHATVVRIPGSQVVECLVEGDLTADVVSAASGMVSQWEIEDWT